MGVRAVIAAPPLKPRQRAHAAHAEAAHTLADAANDLVHGASRRGLRGRGGRRHRAGQRSILSREFQCNPLMRHSALSPSVGRKAQLDQ